MNPDAWKIVVEFDYWYHSKSAHEFQKMLASEKYVILFPDISTRWIVTQYHATPRTDGINPYIWNSPYQEKNIEFSTDDNEDMVYDEEKSSHMTLNMYSENCSIVNIV